MRILDELTLKALSKRNRQRTFLLEALLITMLSRSTYAESKIENKAPKELIVIPENGDTKAEAFTQSLCSLFRVSGASNQYVYALSGFGARLKRASERLITDRDEIEVDQKDLSMSEVAHRLTSLINYHANGASKELVSMQLCRADAPRIGGGEGMPSSVARAQEVPESTAAAFIRWVDIDDKNTGLFYEILTLGDSASSRGGHRPPITARSAAECLDTEPATRCSKKPQRLADSSTRTGFIPFTGITFEQGVRLLAQAITFTNEADAIGVTWKLHSPGENSAKDIHEGEESEAPGAQSTPPFVDILQGSTLELSLISRPTRLLRRDEVTISPPSEWVVTTDDAALPLRAGTLQPASSHSVKLSFQSSGVYRVEASASMRGPSGQAVVRALRLPVRVRPRSILLGNNAAGDYYLNATTGWVPWFDDRAADRQLAIEGIRSIRLVSGNAIDGARRKFCRLVDARVSRDSPFAGMTTKYVTDDDIRHFVEEGGDVRRLATEWAHGSNSAYGIMGSFLGGIAGIDFEKTLYHAQKEFPIVGFCLSMADRIQVALRANGVNFTTDQTFSWETECKAGADTSLGSLGDSGNSAPADTIVTGIRSNSRGEPQQWVAEDLFGTGLPVLFQANSQEEKFRISARSDSRDSNSLLVRMSTRHADRFRASFGPAIAFDEGNRHQFLDLRAGIPFLWSVLWIEPAIHFNDSFDQHHKDAKSWALNAELDFNCLASASFPESSLLNFACRNARIEGVLGYDFGRDSPILGGAVNLQTSQSPYLILRLEAAAHGSVPVIAAGLGLGM